MSYTKKIKVCVIGAHFSGKSEFIKKLTKPQSKFNADYKATISPDFSTRNYKRSTIEIWDTSGQERFESLNMLPIAGLNPDCLMLCIDMSQTLSSQGIAKRIQTLKDLGVQKPIILVWTKSDKEQIISNTEIDAFNKSSYNFQKVFTVSSLENTGIENVFSYLTSLGENHLEETQKSDLDKAIDRLPEQSALYQQIDVLKKALEYLPFEKKQAIDNALALMIMGLTTDTDPVLRTQWILNFEKEACGHLGGAYPKIAAGILGVVIAAVVTVLAAAIGFGIGFLAGSWTGPGAFVSGVLAGSAAACSVSVVSGLTGAGLGFFAGFLSHNRSVKQNEPVLNFSDAVRKEYLGSTKQ